MSNLAKIEQPSNVVSVTDSGALMNAIANAARDPNVDVDKMERLFAMHERMEAKQAERDYADAMTRAQKAMPAIAKDRENKQTKSWYADMEAINRTIVPVYTAQGFSLSFGQAESPTPDCVRVTCDVLHTGGHSKHYFYDNPIDDAGIAGAKNKTPTHGRASATTYAQRYITKLIFNLTLGDEDDDGNGVQQIERITEAQAATIRDMLEATGSNKSAFLAWLKVDSIEAIPAQAFKAAHAALKAKEKP